MVDGLYWVEMQLKMEILGLLCQTCDAVQVDDSMGQSGVDWHNADDFPACSSASLGHPDQSMSIYGHSKTKDDHNPRNAEKVLPGS